MVVVLGGGVDQDADGDELTRMHEPTLRRVLHAVHVWQAAPDASLLLSGGVGGRVREADLMAMFARQLGVPSQQLRIERESRNTIESAWHVAPLLRHLGVTRPYLVTSAVHMPRASAAFAAAGFPTCPLITEPPTTKPLWMYSLVPQVGALRKSTRVWREVGGLAVQSMRARGATVSGASGQSADVEPVNHKP